MPSTVRAAIYARVSTKPQAGEDKISIPDQLRECRKFIEREGWCCAGEYVDPGVTANTIERPALRKLMASINAWDVLVAWDFDRFYREKLSVAGYILDTLDENKKQITSVKQQIPISDPEAYEPRENDTPYILREMAGFTSGIDNRRRYRTLRKGREARLAQGYMLNIPPYGYRKALKVENGKVIMLPREIVPEEAEVVRTIFREYKNGKGYREIAYALNRQKIPSKEGGAWTSSSVGQMIRNPFYCGKVRTNYAPGTRDKKTSTHNPESMWVLIEGKHEPIITEGLWQEAQGIRRRRQKRCRAIGSPLLLSGLLKCGFCGWSMVNEGPARRSYYSCGNFRATGNCQRNGYRRAHLEENVLEYVFSVVRDLCRYEKVQELQTQDRLRNLKEDIERTGKVLASMPARRSKIFELFETGEITKEEFVERKDELRELEDDLRQSLEARRQDLEKLESKRIDREIFEKTVRNFEERFKKADIAKQKADLAAVIESIVIKDKQFRVNFQYSPRTE
jgi:site-specific DNA recombinase